MIVSFRHGFVFIAIPKTGSQAVRDALRPLLAANDWEQCTLLERRFFPVEPLAAIGHGHIEWRELEPFLLGRLPGMASFAVVRDPFARFASFARFVLGEAGLPGAELRARLKALLRDPEKSRHILLREQHRFVCDDGGAVRAELLRYERLEPEFARLGDRLGLAFAPLARVNASPPAPALEWDEELRDMVRTRYAEDFRRFAYDPEGPAA